MKPRTTSRQRVQAALRHEEPDRVPIDFGGRHTIHVDAHRALTSHLGLEGGAEIVRSYLTYTAEPDPRLTERYPLPDPTDPARLAGLITPLRAAHAAGDKAILLNAPAVGIWMLSFYLRGLEQGLMGLAPGGGYVFGSIHNIAAGVPPENIVAMFRAAQACGVYR